MAEGNKVQEIFESLQDIELSEVSLEDIGRAPVAVRMLLAVLAFVLALFAGYYFLVGPQLTKLKAEVAKTEELKGKYKVVAQSAANLDQYEAQIEQIQHEFSLLVSQLPNDTEVPGLLDDITDEGIGNGLEFSSIGLEAETKTDIYVELPIKISLRGGYHNIASFVSGIAGLSRIVTVHDFSIKPENPKGSLLNMTLLAKTYRYDESAGTNTVASASPASK